MIYRDTNATDAEVARTVGISERALNNWKGQYPEFLQSIERAKRGVDLRVEANLFRNATGFYVREEKIFVSFGKVIRVPTLKYYPPDTKAQMFWLANRQPDKWRMGNAPQAPPQDPPHQIPGGTTPERIPFDIFCIKAGYFKPFDKQDEMRRFMVDETGPRMILGARGYGKTDYVTIAGVAYSVYCNWYDYKYLGGTLDDTNLIISKSKTRNTSMIGEIATMLTVNGVPLEKENSTCVRVEGLIGKDHSVEVVTIKTSLRGRHPKRIIMDDPVTEEDVSDATRKLVQRKYNEVLKLTDNVLIIGQPAHKHDLYAKLRGLIKKIELPHGSIPELDHDLDAQRLAGVTEESIQASYFLTIKNEGTTPFDNIKYLEHGAWPAGPTLAWIDPSHEGGDYTSLTILRGHFDGVAVVGFCFKRAWNHCLDEMVPLLKKYHVERLCFETNALGDQPLIMLSELLANTSIGVEGRKSSMEKHSKIMQAGAYAHLIHLSRESDKIYTEQVIEYEYNAKHDDAPDGLASLLEWVGLIRGKNVAKK